MQTILVVDDKASVRTLVREYLTEEGYRVVTAENGRNALYAARHENPWESGTRVVPWCVRAYTLEAGSEGSWQEIVRVEDNYHRFREHCFAPLTADRLRLTVHATHGEGHSARVYRASSGSTSGMVAWKVGVNPAEQALMRKISA